METNAKNTTKVIFLSDGSTWETLGNQVIVHVTDRGMQMLENGDCHISDLIQAKEAFGLVYLDSKEGETNGN